MSPGACTRLMEPYIFCRRKGGVRVCVCFCPRPGGLRVWPATRCQEYRANFHGAAAERQPGHVALVGQPCAMGTGGRQWRAGAGDTVGSRGVQPPRPSTLIQSSRTHCRLGGAPPARAPKASQLGDVGRIPRSWEAEWPRREGQRMPLSLAEPHPPPGHSVQNLLSHQPELPPTAQTQVGGGTLTHTASRWAQVQVSAPHGERTGNTSTSCCALQKQNPRDVGRNCLSINA